MKRKLMLLGGVLIALLLAGAVLTFVRLQTSAPAGPAAPQQSELPAADEKPTNPVIIRFSKTPQSLDDFTYTVRVERETNRPDAATFAVEQLILGPNEQEASTGLFSPLKGKLQGESNCENRDFALTQEDPDMLTIRFCKTIQSVGIGDDARIKETVMQTVLANSSVESAILLTRDGNCFGDQSGENRCLQPVE